MKIMGKIGFNYLTISEGTGVKSLFHFHSRVLMCFHAPLRPRKMDKFLFLGTHTRRVTTKRIMKYMQRFTSVERMIHSDQHESPTTLHCQNPIHVVYLNI
ncbi:hypothetical protein NMG60_11005541 [Bertholletia excelsa]